MSETFMFTVGNLYRHGGDSYAVLVRLGSTFNVHVAERQYYMARGKIWTEDNMVFRKKRYKNRVHLANYIRSYFGEIDSCQNSYN